MHQCCFIVSEKVQRVGKAEGSHEELGGMKRKIIALQMA